jgi:hypothetical protein
MVRLENKQTLITKTPATIVAETKSQEVRVIWTPLNSPAQPGRNKNPSTTITTFHLNNSNWDSLAMRRSTEGADQNFLCHQQVTNIQLSTKEDINCEVFFMW